MEAAGLHRGYGVACYHKSELLCVPQPVCLPALFCIRNAYTFWGAVGVDGFGAG